MGNGVSKKDPVKKEKITNEQYRKGILLFFRFSSWVAGPVIAGSLLGVWLDKKFDTEPFLFLLTIGLFFLISSYGLIKEAHKEYEKVEKEFEDNKKEKDQRDSSASSE